jgi:hypothetical protein
LKELGFDYYICGNGSCLTDGEGNALKVHSFTEEMVKALTEEFISHDRPLLFRYLQGGYQANPNVDLSRYSQPFHDKKQYQKLQNPEITIKQGDLPFAALTHIEEAEKEYLHEKFPQLSFVITGGGLLCDVAWKDVDKGVGLQDLCQRLEINLSDSIAFGDDANDVAMLKKAGIGVAMGNAIETVKQVSDYVTESSIAQGVVQGLRHYEMI